ncbi:MAG: VanZ family protein [Clostridia bacterium]|nr:VanZ family protein [Clostridia bacterium]
MAHKPYWFAALFFYILSVCCFLSVGTNAIFSEISQFYCMIAAVMVFVFASFGTFLRCRASTNRKYQHKIAKSTCRILFLAYLILLIYFTLLDNRFGRNVHHLFEQGRSSLWDYLNSHVNWVPFATVRLFLNGYERGAVSWLSLTLNLTGNLLAFCPFAFFLPAVFRFHWRFRQFFLTVSFIVFGIEIMQLLLQTGSMDIDDYLLNMLGCSVAFFWLNQPSVSAAVSQKTYGVWCNGKK